MKSALRIVILVVIALNLSFAQRAKIKIEGVTPHEISTYGLSATSNTVATGLPVVGNQTNVYLAPQNIANTNPITNAVFQITSKPGGSAASLTTFNTNWVYFKPDVKGAYDVKLTITTAGGSDDTTITIYAADYVGVGNFAGVAGSFPKCMTCHSATPKFSAIFDRWKVSPHANIFNEQIETSTHYSASCMKCHTTGYETLATNGGFDDVASTLGWTYTAPSHSTKWDSLVATKPGLVNLATIGCESCHGAGGEHALGGDKKKIAISVADGVCASCHDEPWRHNGVQEYEHSAHSEAVWESSFAQAAASQNNTLGNCIRCHDGNGYVNFTKGVTTNTTGMLEADHQFITCATCHDPHGNTNTASLRFTPAGSDTLGNGYRYTIGGVGQTCMNCHKSRRNANTYVVPNITSSTFGPHHSGQTDVLLGMNAADFGVPYMSGSHKFAVENACVDCHMYATPDTGNVNRSTVGGHSFSLKNASNGYEYTKPCEGCHGPKTSFDEFEAATDYDGDGHIEGIQAEVDGLLHLLAGYLPPAGDSISWTLIRDANNLNMRKAYYNYQLIAYDGSYGMHNTKFAIDVLTKSINAIGGVTPVELVSFNAEVENGAVTLKWETATETNNKGFEVERKYGNTWKAVTFVQGKGTIASANSYSYAFNLEGTASFRLKQIDLDGTFTYSKVINVTGTITPKEYTLAQNYPNPFNPSTTIRFSLPADSKVKVVIYNITGEVVKVLVNSVQTAGNHDVQFNTNEFGTKVSSGIYFYSLEANAVDGNASFKQTKKMVLMK